MKISLNCLAAIATHMLLAGPAVAGCFETRPAAGSREAAFVRQVAERMPTYLSDFSVPGGAVAVIENGKVILTRGGPNYADKAIASFRRSLALNPANSHAQEMIARIQKGETIEF